MAKPFISFAPQRRKVAEWLAEVLEAFGFEEAILSSGGDTTKSQKKKEDEKGRASFFVALVSPQRGPTGELIEPTLPAPWIEHDAVIANDRNLPIALIWEKNLQHRPSLQGLAFDSEEADFDDPDALLALTPWIIKMVARKMRNFFEKTGGEAFPFVLEKVHILDQFENESEWRHLRTISLSSLKKTESIDHYVDAGLDKSAGFSLKLANPANDLNVTCAESGRIRFKVFKDVPEGVGYHVFFTPPLKPGQTIEYQHDSRHQNVFPMTIQAVESRAQLPGSPPFMHHGFAGNAFDTAKATKELILEIEAPLTLGLASPQVKVYLMNTFTELVEESDEIGDADSRPRLWDVREDKLRKKWRCQVTIPNPATGRSYCLVVRPTK